MTLKVPFGCANCIQGPAWGQNSAQYNAVKIDIHQPEIKTEEQKKDKSLYDYPSASVYDTKLLSLLLLRLLLPKVNLL